MERVDKNHQHFLQIEHFNFGQKRKNFKKHMAISICGTICYHLSDIISTKNTNRGHFFLCLYSLQTISLPSFCISETSLFSLIDFKIEFGRFHDQIILADEISPDTCRFWDSTTHEKLDKDRFRRDMGGVEEAYQELMKRVMGA